MKNLIDWHPIETAPWDEEVILTGHSGYAMPHNRFIVNGYRVKDWHQGDWYDITGTLLSDTGWFPTHWTEMIQRPK